MSAEKENSILMKIVETDFCVLWSSDESLTVRLVMCIRTSEIYFLLVIKYLNFDLLKFKVTHSKSVMTFTHSFHMLFLCFLSINLAMTRIVCFSTIMSHMKLILELSGLPARTERSEDPSGCSA